MTDQQPSCPEYLPSDLLTDDFYDPLGFQNKTEGEGLIDHEIDRREKIENPRDKNNKFPLHSIGQLITTFEDGKIGKGTAVFVQYVDNTPYILTCAHNFERRYSNGTKECIKKMKSARFYPGRKSIDDISISIPVIHYHVHPKYSETYSPFGGYDLALGVLENNGGLIKLLLEVLENYGGETVEMLGISADFWTSNQNVGHENIPISVYGYPAELDKCGFMYGMSGTNLSCEKFGTSETFETMTYRNIDTTHGQSGSPIFFRCSFDIGENEKREGYFIGGIHVAHDSVENHNVATLLTKEKFMWISSFLQWSNQNILQTPITFLPHE